MKDTTRKRKKAIRGFEAAYGRQELIDQMYHLFARDKQGFDAYMKDLGRMMAETIMYIEREEIARILYVWPISSIFLLLLILCLSFDKLPHLYLSLFTCLHVR